MALYIPPSVPPIKKATSPFGQLLTTLFQRDDFSRIDPLGSDFQWLDNVEALCAAPDVVALIPPSLNNDTNDAPAQLTRHLQAQATQALRDVDPALPATLRKVSRRAKAGRRVFSAASHLWLQATFARATDCAWLACLLLYPSLASKATPTQQPLQTRNGAFSHLHTDLSACVSRILHKRVGGGRMARLLDYLQMDFALACTTEPRRLMPCLFGCATFDAFEKAVIDDLQWVPPPHHLQRELAMQAIVDYLAPRSSRTEGELAGVSLTPQGNAQALRARLDQALAAHLDCSPTELALVAPLLLRQHAPLLLLEDLPPDFEHLPDLYSVQLRLGISLSERDPWLLTPETALQVALLKQAQATTQEDQVNILLARAPLVMQWAEYNRILSRQPWYTPADINAALDAFDIMATLAQLSSPPSRIKMAIGYLESFGIKPHEIVSGARKTSHLERLLDSGPGFRHAALKHTTAADITAQFDQLFSAYRGHCHRALKDLLELFIQRLPDNDRAVMEAASLQAYAVHWHEFIGPNQMSIPQLGDADPELWALRRCPALLILCQGSQGETLYRWFPQQWRWDSRAIDRQGVPMERWAREHLQLQFEDYHDAEHPFTYSTAGGVQAVGPLLAPGPLARLVDIALDHVWMHHFDDLRQQCRGMTQLELQQKNIQGRSLAAHLARIGVPFASCFDTQGSGGVSMCVLDAVTLPLTALTPVLKTLVANRRLINRLLHSGGRSPLANTAFAVSRWLNLHQRRFPFNFARDLGISTGQVARPSHGIWHLQPAQISRTYGPPLLDLTPGGAERTFIEAFAMARRGLAPGALALHRGPDGLRYLRSHVDSQVMLIPRADRSVDVLIDGHLYRLSQEISGKYYVRHDRLGTLRKPRRMIETPTPCRIPRAADAPGCASLYTHQLPVTALPPHATAGEHAAHAWQARTYRLGSLAIAGGSSSQTPANLDVVVMDGTLWRRERTRAGRLVPVTDAERATFGLSLPTANGPSVNYLPSISGRRSTDSRFGLTPSLTAEQAGLINDTLPVLELDELVAGVGDRRILRGHVMDTPQGPCIAVEADTHVIYRAPDRPGELSFERVTAEEDINRFLTTSETYRIVSGTPSAPRDRENIATLLFDLAKHQPAPGDIPLDAFTTYAAYAEAAGIHNELLDYATHILAGNSQQLRLFERMQALIPDRGLLTTRPRNVQQAHIDVLNRLAPPQGTSPGTFAPITADNLGDASVHAALRHTMAQANLAFIRVSLADGRRMVYYALSGGKRAAAIRLKIDVASSPRQTLDGVEWVDARAIMRTRGPDPQMTSLPVVRHAGRKIIRPHPRDQDAERLIATVLKADLRDQPVTDLQVFTRMDTCRSCGAIVLPQLKLLFPQASMSINFLEPYPLD